MTSDQQVQPAAATSPVSGSATSRHVHDISWLLDRRSAAVRRLGGPGPSEAELTQILTAALTAPDHGALRPWRIIQCTDAGRVALAELFVAAKLRQKPDAGEAELAREREKALRPPVLLGLLAKPKMERPEITEPEQIACAGAAMQGILLAAFGLGYGAIILSGSRCADPGVRQAMGAEGSDHLLGFISIGTIIDTPIPSRRPNLDDMLQIFDGDLAVKE
jgi:nitroreductase